MIKEELTDFYEEIILILEQEVADGHLTESNRKAILSLLSKSMIRVFYKDPKLLEEVIVLTAPILELEFEKVERLEKELATQKQTFQAQIQAQQTENERLKAELEKYKALAEGTIKN